MIGAARSRQVPILDQTCVGEARREAAELSHRFGFDETAAGKVAIIVTELACNLHKHAKEGSLFLNQCRDGKGIEILAVDRGPGMLDVEKCIRDGYSSSGTSGTGLGSISRLSDRWDIYSIAGSGTVIVATVFAKGFSAAEPLELGSVTVAIKGETRCGDNWSFRSQLKNPRLMMADGLGHGPCAAEAAEEAERIFVQKDDLELVQLMECIHGALRKNRGAAVALAEFDFMRGVVRFVGIGNISGTIFHDNATRSMVSLNGTVGAEVRRVQQFEYEWPSGAALILSSDGLATRWDLSKYPGLPPRHPALLAGVLWRDFARGRDDLSVVVAKQLPQ